MLAFPDSHKIKSYVISQLKCYWEENQECIENLPIFRMPLKLPILPPKFNLIMLPSWAFECGVEGKILVPIDFVQKTVASDWRSIDWFGTIFWFLNGIPERVFEEKHGPIHSYSFKLAGWDSRIWEHAWVNRIGLFLRCWAAFQNNRSEEELFGPLPKPEIMITHDLDAIRKTWAIRLKQTVFNSFNSLKCLCSGDFLKALQKALQAVRFFFSSPNYYFLPEITKFEAKYGLKSHINVYSRTGSGNSPFKSWLFDPGYSILSETDLKTDLKNLHKNGWTIGLHPSFLSWENAEKIRLEKENLEKALQIKVTSCRQHWLRFSWDGTWQAQQEAGLALDSSLGFNDRPGFRNSSGLCFQPWDFHRGKPMTLCAFPLILMDSQLYDYSPLYGRDRIFHIKTWLNEIKSVCGCATVLWHPHTWSSDFQWSNSFQRVIGG